MDLERIFGPCLRVVAPNPRNLIWVDKTGVKSDIWLDTRYWKTWYPVSKYPARYPANWIINGHRKIVWAMKCHPIQEVIVGWIKPKYLYTVNIQKFWIIMFLDISCIENCLCLKLYICPKYSAFRNFCSIAKSKN